MTTTPTTPAGDALAAALVPPLRDLLAVLERHAAGAPPAPAPRPRRAAPPPVRTPRRWNGADVDLTDDEWHLLTAIAQGRDSDGVYRQGREVLRARLATARPRMVAALESLAGPAIGRGPLVEYRRGYHGRQDFALVPSPAATTAVEETDEP